MEKKILPLLLQGLEPATFSHESGALTTEPDPLRGQRPPKGLGTNTIVEAVYRPSTHVNMRRIRPG